MDLFVTVYQTICFPVYRIPKVKRSDYPGIRSSDLPYLSTSSRNSTVFTALMARRGGLTPARGLRTEQYWCRIKHARRIKAAHERYPKFFDHGDAEAFRQGLNRLRRQFEEDARKKPDKKWREE